MDKHLWRGGITAGVAEPNQVCLAIMGLREEWSRVFHGAGSLTLYGTL